MTSVDSSKVDEALEVVEVAESEVYDIDESEYVRKADLNEDQKDIRVLGLKDQLAAAEGEEAKELREDINELWERIAGLTEFESDPTFHTRTQADS